MKVMIESYFVQCVEQILIKICALSLVVLLLKFFTFASSSLCRTIGPMLIKLSIEHHLEKGFKVCSNKGPGFLKRRDNLELLDIVVLFFINLLKLFSQMGQRNGPKQERVSPFFYKGKNKEKSSSQKPYDQKALPGMKTSLGSADSRLCKS